MIQTETNFICGTKNTVCCIFVRYIIDLSSTKLSFYSFVRCGCCDLWEAKSRPRRAQNRHTGSSRCKNSYFFYFWGTGLLGYLILGGSNLFYSPSKEGIYTGKEKYARYFNVKVGHTAGTCVKPDFLILRLAQLPGRLFSPSDICKKLSHHYLLHFSIGMGSNDQHRP